MTAEVLDYRLKQIEKLTGISISDDKSFDTALFELVKKCNSLKKADIRRK